MSKTFYFISDLHIGGDEALGVCDFEDELIHFMDELAQRNESAEQSALIFIVLSIPLGFVLRDLKRTLKRFGFLPAIYVPAFCYCRWHSPYSCLERI